MSLERFGNDEITEYIHRKWLEKQHAMAMYKWCYRVGEFAGRGGSLRALAIWVLLTVARTLCIIFWENLFATVVATVFFCYAVIHYRQFTPGEVFALIFAGAVFSLPVPYFIFANLHLDFISKDLDEKERDQAFDVIAERMNDLLKPLSFAAIIVIFSVPFGYFLVMRPH